MFRLKNIDLCETTRLLPQSSMLPHYLFRELVEVGALPITSMSLHLQEYSSWEEVRGILGLARLITRHEWV